MQDEQNPKPPKDMIAAAADGMPLEVRLEPELIEALERYARELGLDGHRPEWVRAALRDWALSRNYLTVSDEGRRPDELDASNDG